MLRSDASRIATALQEKVGEGATTGQGVSVTVETDQTQPNYSPPGAGRPTFIRYYIRISGGARTALLDLDQAAAVHDGIQAGSDPDGVFDAIRSQEVSIEEREEPTEDDVQP